MADKEFELNCQPLSISFSTSKSNDLNYRGISISDSSHSALLSSHHKPIQFIQPQTKNIENSINQPLNILTKPINIDIPSLVNKQIQSSPINFDIPSLVNSNQFNNYNKYNNKLNSYLVKNCNCQKVLNNINNIFNLQFNDNIDYKINYNNNIINGLVFLSCYHLYFKIFIYSDNNNNNDTIIEFNRISGDALASAKFWSQIKGYYTQIITGKKMDNNTFDFTEFDLSLQLPQIEFENEPMDMNYNFKRLIESLINNDLYVLDELNFLYKSLIENKQIGIDILNNKYLMKELINKSLLNNNICVSRIVLLILNQLIKNNYNQFIVNQNEYKLFKNINILLKHKTDLIKKYTIKLLQNLLLIKNDLSIAFGMSKNEKKEIIESVKQYENVCTNKNYYEIIQSIYQKLNN